MARSRSRRSRGAPECCQEPPAPRYPALHFAWSHNAPSAAARLYERDDRLDLDGNPGRQARRPARAARRQPGLAAHLHHQVRTPVDDGRMIGEHGRRVDEAEHLDDPRNAIERAEVCAQRREHREPVQPRRLTPGRHVERRAELAHAPAAVGAHRPVAGGVEQLPVLEDGRIRGDGLGRRRQDDAERCEAALVRHDRIVWPDIFPRAMTDEAADQAHSRILSTTVGDLPLEEVELEIDGRTWTILHTDRQQLVLHLCRMNAQRNGAPLIVHSVADWTAWGDHDVYDLILGSDILYAPGLHDPLRRIFETNLAPGGRVLVSDPFRKESVEVLEAMERGGWRVSMTKWTVGITPPPRNVGVFDLTRD